MLVATLPIALNPTTGTATRVLDNANPTCKESGLPPGLRCFCDTCNNANAEPCSSNADCPMSGGSAGICGGRRCFGGTNVGAPCVTASQCPGGTCSRAGQPTKPHSCLDDSSSFGLCVDPAPSDGRGECRTTFPGVGPTTGHCINHPQRACYNDFECDDVPGACVEGPRECFLDNGDVGGEIHAVGSASAPVADSASPTLASVFCHGHTSSPALNIGTGLPGPARVILRTTLTAKP